MHRGDGSMKALVTDVHLRNAVAGLRGLGRHDVPMVALGPGRYAAGLWSRYAAVHAIGPDVISDRVGFRASVIRLAERHGPLVVYPGREESLDAILNITSGDNRKVILPYPCAQPLKLLRDKGMLMRIAQDAGIKTPGIWATGTTTELFGASIRIPCVIKPAIPGSILGTARFIGSQDQLQAVLHALPPNEPLLVQEWTPGPLTSLALVIGRDGKLAARMQQIGWRIWPPKVGISCYAQSVTPNEHLVSKVVHMLANIGFWGLAQLQFIGTPDEPALIDFNPRFYGSLPLALACGVNLPWIWHQVAIGSQTMHPQPYRLGVSYRWLEADFTAALLGNFRPFLRGAPRPRVGAMWDPGDPAPSVFLAYDAIVQLPSRLSQLRSSYYSYPINHEVHAIIDKM